MSVAIKKEFLPHYTYDDYKEWEGDWELIYGIPYAMSSPNFVHQEIGVRAIYQLHSKLKDCKRCKAVYEMDWKIKEDTVVRPDVLVVCDQKKKGAFVSKTPEIIFEILSSSTKSKDLGLKKLIYEQERVPYYVVVDPVDLSAEILKLKDDKFLLDGIFEKDSYIFNLNGYEIEFDFKELFDEIV